MFRVNNKFWKIAKRLKKTELQKISSDLQICEEDLFNINIGNRGHDLFLGFYSLEGLKIAFEKYGVNQIFKNKGFKDIEVCLNTTDPYRHKLLIYNEKIDEKNKLVDLVVKKDYSTLKMPFECKLNGEKCEALVIEWLLLQNPHSKFSDTKKQMPGQNYPGLGIASETLELLVIASWRLGLGAIVNIPDHFHNAWYYSKIFHYEDPEDQAKLLALGELSKDVYKIAWALEKKKIYDKSSKQIVTWKSGRQLLPLKDEWDNLFKSDRYKKHVFTLKEKYQYQIVE